MVQELAINGCSGVTDAVWQHLSTPMQLQGSSQAPAAVQSGQDLSFPTQQQGLPTQHQDVPRHQQGLPMQQQGVPTQQQGVPTQQQGLPRQQQGLSQLPAALQSGQHHALQFLSCVGCKNLRSCYLGMVPSSANPLQAQPQHQTQDWVFARCHLAGECLVCMPTGPG